VVVAGRPAVVASPGSADTTTTVAYSLGGLTVLQRIAPESRIVAVRLFMLGGTSQRTAETAGIDALMLGAANVATELDMVGAVGQTNHTVGADWSVTGLLSLREDFDSVWTVFADRVRHQPLPDEAVERARTELVTDARRRKNTRPDLLISEIAQLATFSEHLYGLAPLGTTQSLASLAPVDVERYAAEHLVLSPMLLVVVGEVSQQQLWYGIAGIIGGLYPSTQQPSDVYPGMQEALADVRADEVQPDPCDGS